MHKVLLCAVSGFFDRLCDSQFQESKTAQVSLPEDEPALIARMIIFAYTLAYHTGSIQSPKPEHEQFKNILDPYGDKPTDNQSYDWTTRSKLHIRMYALADKYEIASLKQQSRQRFVFAFTGLDEYQPNAFCNQQFDHVEEPLVQYQDRQLELAQMLRFIYSSTPEHDRGLRDIVLHQLLYAHRDRKIDWPLKSKELLAAISETHQLALDLAIRRFSSFLYKCDICHERSYPLEWRCDCGGVDDCTRVHCIEARKRSLLCIYCLRFEYLSAVP